MEDRQRKENLEVREGESERVQKGMEEVGERKVRGRGGRGKEAKEERRGREGSDQ